MDRTEAASVLGAYLDRYRGWSHAELQRLLMAPVADEVAAPSGKRYQVIVQAVWTDTPGGPLRIVGGIDDAGWQRFTPLVQEFVATPAPATSTPSVTPSVAQRVQ